jgi:hypothetical protein
MDLMKRKEISNMPRRNFLACSSFLLLGAASLQSSPLFAQTTPKGPDVSEALSPEELEQVAGSTMSEDMENFWHKGHSCAETGLIVALRFMKKPEDLVWTASGFAGGLGHQDLCGFLTSGIMALGIHAGDLKIDTNTAKMRCMQMTQEFWTWWTETAPLHCSEIRQGHQDFNVCHRIGRLATAKIESILKKTV